MAVGDEACDQIDEEVDGAAMAGMLNLADVFELINAPTILISSLA